MKRRSKLSVSWRNAMAGAVLCAVLGLILLRWGHELVFLSYDLLFPFRSSTNPPQEVVVVYIDDRSFNELAQTDMPGWDRNLHARLLDRLTEQGAKLVVFDLLWDLPGTPDSNTNLARAIRQNGKVVLAAALDSLSRAQVQAKRPVLPRAEFLTETAGWGITETMSPEKAVVRQYFAGTETQPGLPWTAARLSGSTFAKADSVEFPETWLNYYGPALTLSHVSYSDALNDSSQLFRDKVVFVGARPKTLKPGDEADAFRTPHTLWEGRFMPGVEVTATAFLNLVRNEGLRFWAWPKQVLLVLLAGLVLGGSLSLARPLPALAGGVVVIVVLLVVALQAARQHVWFPWTVVAFAQIPVALAWSLHCHFHRLKFEKEVLERTLVETTRLTEAAKTKVAEPDSTLVIPDHALVRCVGKGAYGEVWLARNVIGVFHAVKIVRRRDFPSDAPYEREFNGIQKFMPISRSHAGFVHVLHVGRNDAAGFFFCIMEAADDLSLGKPVDPERYSPRTLAAVLTQFGKISPEECLQLGLSLSLALEHLHRNALVHRDIKPGNIIYVNGAPKFADIGLVTGQRSDANDVSLVGTEGYIPPEGPGTPAADVYALGKLLYEACMGRDRLLFPEVPTAVWEQSGNALLPRLNEVIGRACQTDVAERFASAAELHAALLKLAADANPPRF